MAMVRISDHVLPLLNEISDQRKSDHSFIKTNKDIVDDLVIKAHKREVNKKASD